jgi:hypothetical protein
MQQSTLIIYSLLGVVVFGLAIYLGILLNKLRLQKIANQQLQLQLEEQKKKRFDDIRDSLRIIALAVTQDQCEVSEGCIRIKKLLDLLEDFNAPQLDTFHEAFTEFDQFDYLDARKSLSKQEKFRQDNRRYMLEEKYHNSIKKSCQHLLTMLRQQ